jgi:hypothetical protein
VRQEEAEIQAMVDRETTAWDSQDAQSLVSLFHPDMVWPWPPDNGSHDPASWVFPMGRYDRERWKASWTELFERYELVTTEGARFESPFRPNETGASRSWTWTPSGEAGPTVPCLIGRVVRAKATPRSARAGCSSITRGSWSIVTSGRSELPNKALRDGTILAGSLQQWSLGGHSVTSCRRRARGVCAS